MPAGQNVARQIAEVGDLFNATTDAQFDRWTDCFNEAITEMGGNGGIVKMLKRDRFSTDDKITVSYFYPISSLSALYGFENDLRNITGKGFSKPLIDVGTFSTTCRGGFQKQTLKRYLNDLVSLKVVSKAGRGDSTMLCVALPAVRAWMKTMVQWGDAFRPVIADMDRLGLLKPLR